MATFTFMLPELGEGIESGDVLQVLVNVGDTITEEQPVLELETDKAVVEVPAPVSGTVKAIHVQAGDKAAVGQLLLTVETSVSTAAAVASPRAPASTPGSLPSASENGEDRTATDTAVPLSPEPPAPTASVPPVIAPSPVPPPSDQPSAAPRPAASAAPSSDQPSAAPRPAAPAAPSVRQLAREIGVDINQVPGSGPGGRIALEDVKRYARDLNTRTDGRQLRGALLPAALPDFAKWGPVERQALGNVRRTTAERMTQSWGTIPHVTQFDKADITDLEQLRQHYDAQKAKTAGGKLTVTSIILKVVAAALKRFPQFNASIDMTTHEVVYKKYYHIGVAVDTDRGLLVPVIRNVDQKNILELSVELTQLAERARSRKTTLEELQGGTFTITNLGGLGGTNFTPIINAPEVAILGLARSSLEPVYSDSTGQFTPRLILPLALSYDHRMIDGADGVRFLHWVVEALQQPFLLALEG
jgi:pyruvate dehydrogenase E2 component (dihydrolipoamide acetyltransferase)